MTNGTGPARAPLPPALREGLLAHPVPAPPLASPGRRALVVLAVAAATAAVGLATRGLRPDLAELGASAWIEAGLRTGLGALLFALALRAGIPGAGPARAWGRAALVAAPIFLLAVIDWAVPVGGHSPVGSDSAGWWSGALRCFPVETSLALPAALLAGALLARAYPLRPVFAATAGATGAALVADAVMHLTCPARMWTHTGLVHGGAVAAVALLGALLGLAMRGKTRTAAR